MMKCDAGDFAGVVFCSVLCDVAQTFEEVQYDGYKQEGCKEVFNATSVFFDTAVFFLPNCDSGGYGRRPAAGCLRRMGLAGSGGAAAGRVGEPGGRVDQICVSRCRARDLDAAGRNSRQRSDVYVRHA